MKAKGTVFKYGDNIDTDVIIPARYLNTSDPKELASHCMEDIDTEFIKKVKQGDIMVGEKNFGCGSSREHAPIAIGLPILECEQAADEIKNGDEVEVDFSTGAIHDLTSGKSYQAQPFPEFIQDIISSGGLIEAVKQDKL